MLSDGEWRNEEQSKHAYVGGFLDVVLLLSVSFHLKIILKRKKIYKQKISYFITNGRSCRKDTDSRTGKFASFME